MIQSNEISYKDAGVDIDYAKSTLAELDHSRARRDEVIISPNDFAGLFSLADLVRNYREPVLVSGTDGVGTKLLCAIDCDMYDFLGQDLVAMCANDVVTKGAEPLFFLDYFATSNLKEVPFAKVVNSMVKACDTINCALIGGETAEMPRLYSKHHFDLAGFVVGMVEKSRMLGAHKVMDGDAIIGLTSSGLHSNGYSLVRKIIFEQLKLRAADVLWQTERSVVTVADELLNPTKLYVNQILSLQKNDIPVHAAAHITGGGIVENVPRIIPKSLGAELDFSQVVKPRIFSFLEDKGPISHHEMFSTFNMGIGMVLIVPKTATEQVLNHLSSIGEKAYHLGKVTAGNGEQRCIVKN